MWSLAKGRNNYEIFLCFLVFGVFVLLLGLIRGNLFFEAWVSGLTIW